MKTKLLKNCRLLDYANPVDVLLENNRITKISNSDFQHTNTEIIDLKNNWIVPGLIDLHIHGAGGGEVYKGTLPELQKMADTLFKFGIMGTTPTTIVNPQKDFEQLRVLKEALDKISPQIKIFGLHLEGPYVHPAKRGGIPAASVLPYNREELLKIIGILGDHLAMMTIAPEISPNMEIIDILLDHNIVPALGHTNINYTEAHNAFDKGIRHVTHVFNAMPSFHHRNPGPLLAILERKDVSVQIISDGVHLDPAVVRYLYRSLGIDNCICVSDGQSIIGLPDGKYDINGSIHVKNGGKATDLDGNLIGTALDAGIIAGNFQDFTGCTQAEALQTVTVNPARVLGVEDEFGIVAEGKIAGLVMVDDNWNIAKIL